jgi:hypothetical protein
VGQTIVLCRLPALPEGGRPRSAMVCPTKVNSVGAKLLGVGCAWRKSTVPWASCTAINQSPRAPPRFLVRPPILAGVPPWGRLSAGAWVGQILYSAQAKLAHSWPSGGAQFAACRYVASSACRVRTGGPCHCSFRFAVQFTTRIRGVLSSLKLLITNFFPSGDTS